MKFNTREELVKWLYHAFAGGFMWKSDTEHEGVWYLVCNHYRNQIKDWSVLSTQPACNSWPEALEVIGSVMVDNATKLQPMDFLIFDFLSYKLDQHYESQKEAA